MLDIEAVKRVLDKRANRGASDESLINWLELLKVGAWKRYKSDIDRLIYTIMQTPLNEGGDYESNL